MSILHCNERKAPWGGISFHDLQLSADPQQARRASKREVPRESHSVLLPERGDRVRHDSRARCRSSAVLAAKDANKCRRLPGRPRDRLRPSFLRWRAHLSCSPSQRHRLPGSPRARPGTVGGRRSRDLATPGPGHGTSAAWLPRPPGHRARPVDPAGDVPAARGSKARLSTYTTRRQFQYGFQIAHDRASRRGSDSRDRSGTGRKCTGKRWCVSRLCRFTRSLHASSIRRPVLWRSTLFSDEPIAARGWWHVIRI